jgi:hypothetical protein
VLAHRLAFCGLTLCTLSAACSGDESLVFVDRGPLATLPDGGVPSVLDTVEPGSVAEELVLGYQEWLDLSTAEATFWCRCETQIDVGSELDLCLSELDPPRAPPVVECSKSVLAKNAHALPSLSCRLGLQRDYVACVESTSNCLDFDHVNECNFARITGDLQCDELPWDVEATIQKRCWGRDVPPPFTCKNGKIINSALKCDIADDCGDRSDEKGCENDPHAGVDGLK